MFYLSCFTQGNNRTEFTSLTIEDGLPSNRTTFTFKDNKGFIWIGCSEGLARYDGDERFEVYNTDNQPALKTDFITVINQDQDDNLWIGTKYGGVTKYSFEEDAWVNYTTGNSNLSNDEILSIMVDANNKVWIGTEDGLNIYDRQRNSFDSYQQGNGEYDLKSQAILEITQDDKGYVWIGTWGSSFYLVLDSNGYNNLEFRQFALGEKSSPEHIWCIEQIGDYEYLLGTHQYGLVYLSMPEHATNSKDKQDWSFYSKFSLAEDNRLDAITSNTVFDMIIIDQDIWLGTPSGLSMLYNFKGQLASWSKDLSDDVDLSFDNKDFDPNSQSSLINNDIKDLFVDDEGLVWVATRGGISLYSANNNQFENLKLTGNFNTRPNTENITVIGDVLWITDGVEVLSYNLKTGKRNAYAQRLKEVLSSNNFSCISSSPKGELLIASNAGIYTVNVKTWEYRLLKLPLHLAGRFTTFIVKKILVDRQSRYWLATQKGILLFDPKTEEYKLIPASESDGLSDASVTDIEEDAEGNIWVSTYSGLNKLIEESPKLKFQQYEFDLADSLSIQSNRLLALQSSNDYLLIGSDQGLILYDYATKSFNLHNPSQNNTFIHTVYNVNDSIVWGSSTEGLYRYNLIDHKVSNFSTADGIKDLTFNIGSVTSDADGKLYFGNISGAVSVNPLDYKETISKPKVYCTKAYIIGQEGAKTTCLLSNDSLLELNHNDYYLSLSYVGLNYNKPSSTSFAHKLEGFDEDWVSTDNPNYVTYTNLKAGSYIFRAKAQNNDGYWAELDSPLKIKVIPAFWQRLWFWILSAFLFFAGLFMALRKYTQTVRRRNQKLEELNLQLSDEVKQRTQIAKELRQSEDNLKTTNTELMRSNKQLEEFAYIASHDLKEPLRTIGTFTELTKRKLDSDDEKLNEYMDIVKSAVGRMHNLVESILTFSSVDKGSLKLAKIDLKNIVERNLLDLQEMITSKKTEIEVSALPQLWADKSQLSMLFQNLISNGIKFNTSATPFLKIYTKNEADPKYVHIVVEDNGIGINKEFQTRIFELFKRLHSSSEFEGTGIGLAVCKQIVELHEGKLEIDSEVGKGTKFVISLPKYKDATVPNLSSKVPDIA